MPLSDSDVEAARILPADGPAEAALSPQTAAPDAPEDARRGCPLPRWAIAAVAGFAATLLALGVSWFLLKPPWGVRGAMRHADVGGGQHPSLPVYAEFEMVRGGGDHACRSRARSGDDNDTRTVHASSSLANCKALCVESVLCRGIGFQEGQCEVWTVAVEAGTPAKGLACFQYVTDVRHDHEAKPEKIVETTGGISAVSSMRFDPVDGGANRACRGADAEDDAGGNKVVLFSRSLFDCKAKCLARSPCAGVEFRSGRCEVWKVPITVSVPMNGFRCLRYRPGKSL